MIHDFEEINDILNSMADDGILEPMAEPIDFEDCGPFDYAEVTGLWDEMYPEPMVDSDGQLWYVG